jgi:hypothetical protein
MLLQLHINGEDDVQDYAKTIRLGCRQTEDAPSTNDARSPTPPAHPISADVLSPTICERATGLAGRSRFRSGRPDARAHLGLARYAARLGLGTRVR